MYETLSTQINNYIKANANNEITGPILNSVLVQMLNALGSGMNFYGMANTYTVPVTDEYPKFYIAFTPGSYVNFNLSGQVAFKSGFAILYDEAGDNTWQIAVKSMSDLGTSTFLVDAQVLNSVYAPTDIFFIKEATRSNAGSSFSLYRTDEGGTNEILVSNFAKSEFLSGYNTHKILDVNGNTEYIIGVNWDDIPANTPTTFTPADTKFPKTAYVDLYEVEPSVSNATFLVDAAVPNNPYTPNIVFYIKRAVRHSSGSTFQVYKVDQITGDEFLAARALVSGALASGYGTYTIQDVTTAGVNLKVSVNWDEIPEASTSEDFTEFVYEETKFPKTAYVAQDTATTESILSRRLDIVEALNNYKVTNDSSINKLVVAFNNVRFSAAGWAGPGMDVNISSALSTEFKVGYSSGSADLAYAWGMLLTDAGSGGDYSRPLRLIIDPTKLVQAPRYSEIMLTNAGATAYNIHIVQNNSGAQQVVHTVEFSRRSLLFLRLTTYGGNIYVSHQLFSRNAT